MHLILQIYHNAFERVYIWSPSIFRDPAWKPVIEYIKDDLKVDNKKDKCLFDNYVPAELENVITTQNEIIDYLKSNDKNDKLYSILIIIDDFADAPSFTRNSKLLHGLYTRGRHSYISSIISSQVFTTVSPIIRRNLSSLYVFKLTNIRELEGFVEEYSGLAGNKKRYVRNI